MSKSDVVSDLLPLPAEVPPEPEHPRWSAGRIVFLLVTGLCLYLFAPSIAEVFNAWNRLGELNPGWVAVVLGRT